MKLTDNHLIAEARTDLTPNFGGMITPKFIVIRNSLYNFATTAEMFGNGDTKSSSHLLLDEKGAITQFLPFTVKSYALGASYWKGHTDLNAWAITITVTSTQQATEDALEALLPLLVERYKIREIVFHHEVCIPEGRVESTFVASTERWLKTFAAFDNAGGEGNYIVVTHDVAVLDGPHPGHTKVATLNRGDTIKVIKRVGDYYLVAFDTRRGFVAEGLIAKS